MNYSYTPEPTPAPEPSQPAAPVVADTPATMGKTGKSTTTANTRRYIQWGIVVVLFFFIGIPILKAASPFAQVPAGSRGVVTTFGKISPVVLPEGLHIVRPFMDKVHLIDVRIQRGEGQGEAASKDLQLVQTAVAVNYHIDPSRAADVFASFGFHVAERILQPAVQEAVKASTAQMTAEELVTKRPEVRELIKIALAERITKYGLILDEFSIVNFKFSESFASSVEVKATAEQRKLTAERDLERIKVEGDQKIAQARAEAESLRIQREQITRDLLELRRIENENKAISKWDGRLPTTVAGDNIPFIQTVNAGERRADAARPPSAGNSR